MYICVGVCAFAYMYLRTWPFLAKEMWQKLRVFNEYVWVYGCEFAYMYLGTWPFLAKEM